jgi:hypothetical protein
VAGRALLDLKKLSFDRTHSGHQPIQFRKEQAFILASLLDQFRGRAMTDAMKGVGQLAVQNPHVILQVQEFLVKLDLLEHGRGLA